MSEEGGSGAPATGGTTDGGTTTAPEAPATGTTTEPSPWESIASEYGDPDKVRKALEHARTWEQRAKENRAGAQQAKTLEQQLAEFQQQMSERDERDVERSSKTALAQLKAELGQAGIKWDDVDEALRPDPMTLLKNGEPDDERIDKLAAALSRHAGRPAPDPDQGRRSSGTQGTAPGGSDMNELFRSKVRSLRN
jgi:hypothetical protein